MPEFLWHRSADKTSSMKAVRKYIPSAVFKRQSNGVRKPLTSGNALEGNDHIPPQNVMHRKEQRTEHPYGTKALSALACI